MKIALGTRFYEENPEKLKLVESFARKAPPEIGAIFIAVNDTADKTGAGSYLQNLHLPRTETFTMNVRGKFTPALNALVYNASVRGFSHLLLCSLEIDLEPRIVQGLVAHMDKQTLVVGAALAGHEFTAGEVEGNGTTIPWNTLALWNLKYLSRTGFLLAGDAPFDPEAAGVEELATCAALQTLYPELAVKLVEIPGVEWKVGQLGLQRVMAHVKKIKSKKERAAKQLEFLELNPPRVVHIAAQ